MEPDERGKALAKLREVYEAGKEYFEAGEHYSYEDYCKTLGKLTTRFGGGVQDTGGHVLVAHIPAGEHHLIGVTDEVVVLCFSRETIKDLDEAAWESTELGAISYCDKTGLFFQLESDRKDEARKDAADQAAERNNNEEEV